MADEVNPIVERMKRLEAARKSMTKALQTERDAVAPTPAPMQSTFKHATPEERREMLGERLRP
mgnify:CR=1 FL=1